MKALPGLIGFIYGFVGLASLSHFMIRLATLLFLEISLGFDRQSLAVVILYDRAWYAGHQNS